MNSTLIHTILKKLIMPFLKCLTLLSLPRLKRTYFKSIWLDTIKNLKSALAQQQSTALTVFVVYDLSGRDYSLANLVTNLDSIAACRDSEKYYLDGHAYLIQKFGILLHVAMYLDIGHAFWLGWDDNRKKADKVYAKIIISDTFYCIKPLSESDGTSDTSASRNGYEASSRRRLMVPKKYFEQGPF
ncbi:1, 4-beta cellobiohydrolase [Neocallimastix sp. 'constans']